MTEIVLPERHELIVKIHEVFGDSGDEEEDRYEDEREKQKVDGRNGEKGDEKGMLSLTADRLAVQAVEQLDEGQKDEREGDGVKDRADLGEKSADKAGDRSPVESDHEKEEGKRQNGKHVHRNGEIFGIELL